MWYKLGKFILKNRFLLLILLLAATGFMSYKASQLTISYEFSKAIPTDNQKYIDYKDLRSKFGADGSVIVAGVQTDKFYNLAQFKLYKVLIADIKKVHGITNVLSVPSAITLVKNDSTEKLVPSLLFPEGITTQTELDSARSQFENLIFYHQLLYNPSSKAYLAAITVDTTIFNSKQRTKVVADVMAAVEKYKAASGQQMQLSGLPLIRTLIADSIKNEMFYFLAGSLLLAIITLLLFFRSASSTAISMVVVIMGVVWSMGTMVLMGYKISLLTALIPPLIIVIGIPNCIYFLNKYHMSWQAKVDAHGGKIAAGDTTNVKNEALATMVGKMGIVTLFCNIAAAIGFAVFALTRSDLLREFGAVAGINIFLLFFISLIFIPVMLSFLPPPKERHVKYLRNRFLENVLVKIEFWVLKRKPLVLGFTAVIVVAALFGIARLKSVGYMVDDLPKQDKIYTDLKWFEKNFGGVLPLEIMVDTKKKNGVTSNLSTIEKIDEFSAYIAQNPYCARPISLVEGLKFVKQAYYDSDSTQYVVPNEFDMAFLSGYLKTKKGANTTNLDNALTKVVNSFMDSTKQRARISVNIADVGTEILPRLLDSFQKKSAQIFDTASYKVVFTGGSVSYLEGSHFIIEGLKDSIKWAFLLIAFCMLILFRSLRILFCSLIPNLIPLVVTAGLMGWAGVPLKPSTVLVFSIALGIAIDITIRFLVNYKQELPYHKGDVMETTTSTIRSTGISIIYTSLVLVAGFVIFMFSKFGGTMALGWLTSFTLLIATLTNLVFLPVMLIGLMGKKKQ